MSYAHPVLWLLDLAAYFGEHHPATSAPAASSSSPPRGRESGPRARGERRTWRLTFGVIDQLAGPVVECHELEADLEHPGTPDPRALAEWHRVLVGLEAAGRLTFWHLERRA